MKKTVFLLLGIMLSALFFSTGCTNKNQERHDSLGNSLTNDTTNEDSLSELVEEEPMPIAADELFDDFLFNYAANNKVQKKRTVFPLPVSTYGKESLMSEASWKRERFFMKQGFYVLILHKASQYNITKDTTVNEVTVEKISANQGKVTRWHFARKRGLWYMDKLSYLALNQHPDAQFIKFYHKFANDSIFQQQSLDETVSFTGPDPDDDFSTMTGEIIPEQWPMFAPWMPQKSFFNIIYGSKPYPASNMRFFYIRGIANGLQTDLVFEHKGKKWKLKKVNT